jgi:hypothetical protein
VAVDDEGNVLTYDGSSWSSPDSIDGLRQLNSVSCPTASFCAAVDESGYVLTYNGSSWSSPDKIDSQDWLNSVSCPTASFCAAVDLNGNAFTYNGSSWSSPDSIDGSTLFSVSCPTASFCAAADWSGNVLTYNGSSWSSPDSIDAGNWLYSVSCPTTSFCAAVDANGNAFTYNGSSWSSPDSIDAGNWLVSVSCPNANFCAAVDSSDAFIYSSPAVGTLTQGSPTSASVAEGAGYSGQLAVTNGVGTVSYTETSSTDSGDVVVNSTGAISATISLAPGTYTVGGGDSDTNGDTGTWSFTLTVNPAVVTPPPSGGSPPPSSSSPPSPPSGATSSQNCSSSSSSGTCSVTNDGTTVTANEEGAVTVSQYGSDPVGSPSFSAPGEYFDVQVASGSSFASLTITDCNLNGGTGLEWWNGGAWEPVSPAPTYTAGPPACVSATIDSTSSPSLSQLTGTVFAVSALAAVPGTPTKVSAKAGNASATLTWTAPSSDGGAAITGYVIKPSRGPAVRVGDVTSDTLTGLTNGTAYRFTVAAVNSVGTGPSSAVSNSVTPTKATSETVLKLSSKKVTYGDEQAEHLSVTVSPQHSGPTVTGTVTIKAATRTLCVIKLKSAKGSCRLSPKKLKAGTYRLVATYSGSANYKGSISAKETLTVAKS